MQPEHKKARDLYPDLVRTTGICLIVMLHVAAILFYQYADQSKWISCLFFDSPARVGVPLFFMLSGALLLTKQEPIHVFFQKRFFKVLIPLIVWSVFYLVWRTVYHKQSIPNWFYAILNGPTYPHLGFIYVLISLYLTTPVLRYFYQAADFFTKLYYLIFAFYAASFLPFFTLLSGKTNPIWIDLQFFSGWIGYFILGAFIAEYNDKKYKNVFLGLFVLGSLATALLTIWWSAVKGNASESFFEYLAPNVIFSAIGLFYFLKSSEKWLKNCNKKIKNGIVAISKTSFGIYLIHLFVLEILGSGVLFSALNAEMGNPYITVPCISVLCLVLSFLIVFIMQKVPVLKHCVP